MHAFLRFPPGIWPQILLLTFGLLPMLVTGCRSNPFARRSTCSVASSATADAVATTALGASFEDIDARNRANIVAQLGRPVAEGPATPAEVIAMSRAGVEPRFIVCYVNRSNNVLPVTAQDVIEMHQQGVNEQVIQAMLTPGAANTRTEVARSMPPRVVILTDPWWPYYHHPHYGVAMGYGYSCY